MSNFDFYLITRTHYYKKHKKKCMENNLTQDICRNLVLKPPREQYINVMQKSPIWYKLREQSHGTASSLGKFIPGDKWTSEEELNQQWKEYLENKPFVKTHTMEGHMKWGTVHEDLALFCFAEKYNKCVVQVGTIRVDHKDIKENMEVFYPHLKTPSNDEFHLLISPDGIVCNKTKNNYNEEENKIENIIGMLEIKCISPFFHLENENNNLIWCDDIEKRQWKTADDIPHVYLIQMALQAVCGIIELDMTFENVMYFERWSPKGFSVFCLSFDDLFKVGILASTLYFMLLERSKKEENFVAYPLHKHEEEVNKTLQQKILATKKHINHVYHNIQKKHPYFDFFNNYYLSTQHEEFDLHQKDKKCLI